MAILKPFRAIRPVRELAEKIAAPPYDVVTYDEAKKIGKKNPYSFLHISRSEIDFEDGTDPYSYEVYEKAAKNLYKAEENGWFQRDGKPLLYVYRQEMDGRQQIGIIGCVSVDDYINGTIKRHELTRVEKEIDRINHFDICRANTEPVFLTYRDNKQIDVLVNGYIATKSPEYNFKTSDGVRHEFYPIYDDNVILGLSGLFKHMKNLYIADGHHRSASAAKVGQKYRKQWKTEGDCEFNYFMAAIIPGSQLKIYGYNRLVNSLKNMDSKTFLKKICDAGFIVGKIDGKDKEPEKIHEITMFIDETWYSLKLPPENIPKGLIESLDVSILQEKVLAPILGIRNPREDSNLQFMGGIKGAEALEEAVKGGEAQVGFAMYPVSINTLFAISDNELTMPPKSTWFEPKLASGLFIHSLMD